MRRRIETFAFTFRQISLICAWKNSKLSMVTPRSLICVTESSTLLSITKGVGKLVLWNKMDWDFLWLRAKFLWNQEARRKVVKDNILSYYPNQIEKNNWLAETELALGKALKSCESFILKAVFVVESVEYTINVSIINWSQLLTVAQIGECELDRHKLCLNYYRSKLIRLVS